MSEPAAERHEMVRRSAPRWVPTYSLTILGIFFVAAIALAVMLVAGREEPFAIGLAVFGAVVMAAAALLGFGPGSRE